MRALALAFSILSVSAGAQEYRLPTPDRVALYQERFEKVYLPMNLSRADILERMQAYFGGDYGGVRFAIEDAKDGTSVCQVRMVRDGRVVYLATIAILGQ